MRKRQHRANSIFTLSVLIGLGLCGRVSAQTPPALRLDDVLEQLSVIRRLSGLLKYGYTFDEICRKITDAVITHDSLFYNMEV